MNNQNYAEAADRPAPVYDEQLNITVKYFLTLNHHEQVDFFNDLRQVLLKNRDEQVAIIRSEIEAAQRRVDEILKGQEVIAKF